MKTITKSLRPYGHAHSSLIGRYLVEQGIADTRAIKMAQGLEQFMIAIACMDERNKKILYHTVKIRTNIEWWRKKINTPVEMRIGFRANETRRAANMNDKLNKNGLLEMKAVVGKRKTRNKWGIIEWQKPSYPLIKDGIYKDNIEKYWKNKNVRFARINNCVGCFHQNLILARKKSKNINI